MGGGSRESRKAGGSSAAESGGEELEADPRVQVLQNRMRVAKAYNDAHPDQVEDFDRLTGGVASRGVRAIMAWQRAHGLGADGKVGPGTLSAAATAGSAKPEPAEAGSSSAASNREAPEPTHVKERPHATLSADPAEEEDGLAGELVAGGNTVGQDHRPKEQEGQASKEGGEWAGEGAEKALERVAGEGLKGEAVAKGCGGDCPNAARDPSGQREAIQRGCGFHSRRARLRGLRGGLQVARRAHEHPARRDR